MNDEVFVSRLSALILKKAATLTTLIGHQLPRNSSSALLLQVSTSDRAAIEDKPNGRIDGANQEIITLAT